jgi:hypothetical protein
VPPFHQGARICHIYVTGCSHCRVKQKCYQLSQTSHKYAVMLSAITLLVGTYKQVSR